MYMCVYEREGGGINDREGGGLREREENGREGGGTREKEERWHLLIGNAMIIYYVTCNMCVLCSIIDCNNSGYWLMQLIKIYYSILTDHAHRC